MTYVVTEKCIRCKFMDCVAVCPVDCFYEGENMLVINPHECIDCGVCEPNARRRHRGGYRSRSGEVAGPECQLCPAVAEHSRKEGAPADAEAWMGIDGKFETAFSRRPRPRPDRPSSPLSQIPHRRRNAVRKEAS